MTLYDNLIDIGGDRYIFDAEALTKAVKTGKNNVTTVTRITEQRDVNGKLINGFSTIETDHTDLGPEVDVSKFEILNGLVNTVLLADLEDENSLGAANMFKKAPIGFKLAFNTLLSMGIIKEI